MRDSWQKLMKNGSVAVGLVAAMALQSAWADSLSAQRERYQQVKSAWDGQQMDEVARLLPTLREYPLYPYLEYRQLTQDLSALEIKQANGFITRYPTLPLSRNLKTNFINELARRQDWQGIVQFVTEAPTSTAARCNFYYAKWATGAKQEAYKEAGAIWLSGKSLPSSCEGLFDAWRSAGLQTPESVLERIRLASRENNTSLVSALTKKLPASYKSIAEGLNKLQKDPMTVDAFARNFGPTDFTREETRLAFARAARKDVDKAQAMIPQIAQRQKMSKQALEEIVAGRLINTSASAQQAVWRDGVISRSQDMDLIERRIRLALSEGDKKGVSLWVNRLSADTAAKDEWRYWRADALIERGKRSEGEAILRDLMTQRGFYPMVAAQRLGVPYVVKLETAVKPTKALTQRPEVNRVRELMYWGMDNLARSEWSNLISSLPKPDQEALARYAYDQGWADLSVQATIVAKLWDHLQERFPLAYPTLFKASTNDKDISVSFAMAIARQESAWNPQAQSPVGARGLMQLMPATAKHTAKQNDISTYSNVSQLFDPQTNIQLGTTYLEHTYQTFGQNRILAAAAYNAGPNRVSAWLNNSAGRLNAVAFVESIPFNETRGYVKNVLAYDLFYRSFMSQPGIVMTDAEWSRAY
ncbi:murein transglycosylase [Leminorella grimontii]|uniref:peptidoglycan lytic exotransglycosylase n=2 Tax=Leminorella grimontii TaxID=82981 RepID=A0AAV5N513_9GAMM|nr:soluble lytic murein transglycosylase [Leminorella grimontii ATCC 33999 = DSM 5078]GKX56194.1 murein transglycosylase [Leminorella grimontii]VFS60991.1 Soluble lytic murein transglycosylase precursor [Leminorella grimontii]